MGTHGPDMEGPLPTHHPSHAIIGAYISKISFLTQKLTCQFLFNSFKPNYRHQCKRLVFLLSGIITNTNQKILKTSSMFLHVEIGSWPLAVPNAAYQLTRSTRFSELLTDNGLLVPWSSLRWILPWRRRLFLSFMLPWRVRLCNKNHLNYAWSAFDRLPHVTIH